jgi:hypothetical protein
MMQSGGKMKTRLMITIPAIVALSILTVFVYDSIFLDKVCQDSGGKRVGDTCLAPIVMDPAKNDPQSAINQSKIKTMKPNSMEYFYYPNPEDITDRDVFQKFILIRLPEELGGDADDVSAFRAYSALSVGVHCQIKYWPHEERKRMEDPCWGSIYRPIDGLMIAGERPVVNNAPVALPYLDLSIDGNGSLHVEPPRWTLDENGVVGEGRDISLQQIHQGSQVIVDSYEQTNPNHPKIPIDFAGQILTQINPSSNIVEALYHDFSSHDWYGMTLYIRNVSAQDQQHFLNLAKHNSEFWQISETAIRIWGSALDKNNEQSEGFREYNIEFILNGFKFTIEGQDIDLMKKAIVASYFPGNDYDDMFLVSSTVK